MMHKAWSNIEEVPYCISRSSVKFQGHKDKKLPNLIRIKGFRTVTQVWIIHGFEMMHKAWCSTEEVPYCFPRSSVKFQGQKKTSILTQIGRFRTVNLVWIHWWLWNDAQSLKQHRSRVEKFWTALHGKNRLKPLVKTVRKKQVLDSQNGQNWSKL